MDIFWALPAGEDVLAESDVAPPSAEELPRLCPPLWRDVAEWKYACDDTKAGFANVDRCGAVFDPVRRVVFENSFEVNGGKDIFVTKLGVGEKGTNERKRDIVPFDVFAKAVYDGVRFAYFQAKQGRQFGGLKLEKLEFKKLADAPREFGEWNGFFVDGNVFCFDKTKKAMRYDCENNVWKDTELSLAGKCMVLHPWEREIVVELMWDGSVREVRVRDGQVLKTYRTNYGKIEGYPECLALPAPHAEFLLVVCDGDGCGPWRVFSSEKDAWMLTDWPKIGVAASTTFFDPVTRSVFFHMLGDHAWISATEPWETLDLHVEREMLGLDKGAIVDRFTVKALRTMTLFGKDVFADVEYGGAIFDPERRLVVESLWRKNNGRDIVMIHLDDGEVEVKSDRVPFNVWRKPIFDNKRYVYFHEDKGKHFGRLDLDAMTFETLADAPIEFGVWDGFFMEGIVICVSRYRKKIMLYDCKKGTWEVKAVFLASVRVVPHPWQKGMVIELMHDGTVREVHAERWDVIKKYTSSYGEIEGWNPEMITIPAPGGAFFLLACDGANDKPWRAFYSKNDQWIDKDWPTSGTSSSTTFFDPVSQSVYFHKNSEAKWTCISVDSEVLALSKKGFKKCGRHAIAAFDPVSRIRIEISWDDNNGKDVFITPMTGDESADTEVKEGLIPFCVWRRPVCDNRGFMYFQEKHGKQFGRLNMRTMEFEVLSDAPHSLSGEGFFLDGGVFGFNNRKKAMRYDCEKCAWSDTSLTVSGRCMIPHPSKKGTVLELFDEGYLREVSVESGDVIKTYRSKYGSIESIPETIALPARGDNFFLLVCNGAKSQPWRRFSSETDQWSDEDWPTTGRKAVTAFFDPAASSVLFQRSGEDTIVRVPAFNVPRVGNGITSAGFASVNRCGVVFDPVRRMVLENSWNVNAGKDIFVTRLNMDGSGTDEVFKDLVPFITWRKPLFDNERYVYTKAVRDNLDGSISTP